MARLRQLFYSVRVRVGAAALAGVLGVGFLVPAEARQDTTTLLALFLRDLRNGTLGTINAITSIKVGDGAASAPSYGFASDPDTGLYRVGANNVALSVGGGIYNLWSVGQYFLNESSLVFGVSGVVDVSLSRGAANRLDLASGDSFNVVSGNVLFASKPIFSGTAPTTPVACTSPTVTWATGTVLFQIDVGTSCTGVTTLAFTLPTATNGWHCTAVNTSTAARDVVATAWTTTSVTLTNFVRTTGVAGDWAAGADVRVGCTAG